VRNRFPPVGPKIQPGTRTPVADAEGDKRGLSFCTAGFVFHGRGPLAGKDYFGTAAPLRQRARPAGVPCRAGRDLRTRRVPGRSAKDRLRPPLGPRRVPRQVAAGMRNHEQFPTAPRAAGPHTGRGPRPGQRPATAPQARAGNATQPRRTQLSHQRTGILVGLGRAADPPPVRPCPGNGQQRRALHGRAVPLRRVLRPHGACRAGLCGRERIPLTLRAA
jgi:hypothetical protein